MTVKEFLASIDPETSNWKTLSPGHWQNTATGAKYDTTDLVQAQLDAYNNDRSHPPFIPGITPVPPGIQVTPGGNQTPPGNKPTPNEPGPTTGGTLPPGAGGVTPPPGTNYIPGSTWNQGGPGAGGTAPGASGFSGAPTWHEQAGSGTGGPQHTGMAMPFSPYGDQQQLSSEILKYGGRPNSGKGGYWSGVQTPTMRSAFTPRPNATGSAAGPLDPFVSGGSDPAGQVAPGGPGKPRPTHQELVNLTAAQAAALREYLHSLPNLGGSGAILTGTGTGGLNR